MIDPMPSDIFQRGQILNNTYEIEGILGRGGTGEVYRARNQIVGRVVAIKALNARFSGKADYIELMKREEQMRNIISDSVVRYSECSRTDDGHVFLVMDYIDGPSLNDLMLERRVDEKDLLIIAHRVAEGLVTTHANGIVHRDLSPDNIILRDGKPEKAVIIDFGIAKDTATGARTIVGNEFAGKYEYAAPEQLDGKSDARSDIYSLGALLLAAYRGEVPFPGNTPGEIVRRKQMELDTNGVPEPLKGLIDWMAAPDINARPGSARELLERIEGELKPVQSRQSRSKTKHKNKGKGVFRWTAALLILAAMLAGAYYGGLLDGFLKEPIPVASPYELRLEYNPDGDSILAGNAPDKIASKDLETAFKAATGATPGQVAVTVATGMPFPGWAEQMQKLIGLLAPLQQWKALATDKRVSVTGLAPDVLSRAQVASALSDWANDNGMEIFTDIAAGPKILLAADIQPALDSLASCGQLEQVAGADARYELDDTIAISGNVMSTKDNDNIAQLLAPVIGDRKLRFDTNPLNAQVCKIRNVLPPAPTRNISIWLGDGETGKANLSGVYTVGQNPIVDIRVPADITEGALWVMIVDTDGEVYHILPNINAPENRLANLGTVEGGVRTIRVLHSIQAFLADQNLRAFRISEGDFGKSEVIAILSKTPLFDTRRPGTESVASVAEALKAVIAEKNAEIIGVATRIIDARK